MRLKTKFILKCLQAGCFIRNDYFKYSFVTTRIFVMGKYPMLKLLHRDFCTQSEPWKKIYSENELKIDVIHSETALDFRFRGSAVSKHQEDILNEFVKNNKYANEEQWEQLKNRILEFKIGFIKSQNFGGRVLECCCGNRNLSLGRSYLSYCKSQGLKLNLGIVCLYLKLCGVCKSECTPEELVKVKRYTDDLWNKFPVLNNNIREALIIGFSITDRIKESAELFNAYDESDKPRAELCSILLCALLEKDEITKFWDIINKAVSFDALLENVYLSYIEKYKNDETMLNALLNFFRGHGIMPNHDIVEKIREVFMQLPRRKKYNGVYVYINSGQCQACNQNLNPVNITDEEFNKLRSKFLERVFIGENVFTKSTPKEVAGFINFIRNTAPYDIVIDGLNVSYMKNIRHPTMNSFRLMDFSLLETVLDHFVQANKKVLVIGRKHMKLLSKWYTKNMKKNVFIYLTHDSSSDDQFMLYAAMYSGIDTFFISRDLMRQQKFRLNDSALSSIFKSWQLCRQYKIRYIDVGNKVYFEDPLIYEMTVQSTKKRGWHIPYIAEGGTNVDSYEMHQHWLCIHPC